MLRIGFLFSRAWSCDSCFSTFGTGVIFFHIWHGIYFPALSIGFVFFRAWHHNHAFLCLALDSCFSAFGTGVIFSHVWHQIFSTSGIGFAFPRLTKSHVFPLLPYFPSLSIRFHFSRVWQRNCFVALSIRLKLRDNWHRVYPFSRLALESCVRGRGTSITCSCAWHQIRVLPHPVLD